MDPLPPDSEACFCFNGEDVIQGKEKEVLLSEYRPVWTCQCESLELEYIQHRSPVILELPTPLDVPPSDLPTCIKYIFRLVRLL